MHRLKQHQITTYRRTGRFVVLGIYMKKMTFSALEEYKSVNKKKGVFICVCVSSQAGRALKDV